MHPQKWLCRNYICSNTISIWWKWSFIATKIWLSHPYRAKIGKIGPFWNKLSAYSDARSENVSTHIWIEWKDSLKIITVILKTIILFDLFLRHFLALNFHSYLLIFQLKLMLGSGSFQLQLLTDPNGKMIITMLNLNLFQKH